jgi:hypothetical protein
MITRLAVLEVALFMCIGQVSLAQTGSLHGAVMAPYARVWAASVGIVSDVQAAGTEGRITVTTDQYGKYAVELPVGQYKVCASHRGLEEACHCIRIEEGRDTELNFSMPVDKAYILPAQYDVTDRRLQILSGKQAVNCGHVRINEPPKAKTSCALTAHKHNKAFFIRYDVPCGDCEMSFGLAADELGRLFAVRFDSMGMSTWELSPAQSMPDGIFTVVAPCPPRPGLRITRTGALSCFNESEKAENIMQQLDEPALATIKPKQ